MDELNPLGFVIPLVLLIPVALATFLWQSRTATIEARPEPPQEVYPWECGYVLDGRLTPRDILAALLNMAQLGVVRLVARDATLHGLQIRLLGRRANVDLSIVESDLYEALEVFGSTVSLTNLNERFTAKFQRVSTMLLRQRRTRTRDGSHGISLVTAALSGLVLALAFAGFGFVLSRTFSVTALAGGIFAGLAALVMVLSVYVSSDQASSLLAHVQGVSWFLKGATPEAVASMVMAESASAVFERYLPYAVDLGLVSEWYHVFDGLPLEPPSWYDTSALNGEPWLAPLEESFGEFVKVFTRCFEWSH